MTSSTPANNPELLARLRRTGDAKDASVPRVSESYTPEQWADIVARIRRTR